MSFSFSCLLRIHQRFPIRLVWFFHPFGYKQHLDPLGCLMILDRGLRPSCSETGTFEKEFLWMLKSITSETWAIGILEPLVSESQNLWRSGCVFERVSRADLPKNKLMRNRWDQSCKWRTVFLPPEVEDSWWQPNSGAICPCSRERKWEMLLN